MRTKYALRVYILTYIHSHFNSSSHIWWNPRSSSDGSVEVKDCRLPFLFFSLYTQEQISPVILVGTRESCRLKLNSFLCVKIDPRFVPANEYQHGYQCESQRLPITFSVFSRYVQKQIKLATILWSRESHYLYDTRVQNRIANISFASVRKGTRSFIRTSKEQRNTSGRPRACLIHTQVHI